MYHGGNHYDRSQAGGVPNMYANGVNFHSDGLPNEPKKSHLQAMHFAIAQVSADLVASDAQYKQPVQLPWRYAANDSWSQGTDQLAFVYGSTVFVESNAPRFVQTQYNNVSYDMAPQSILVLQGGEIVFNSSHVKPVNVKRVNTPVWSAPLQWQVWSEGVFSTAASASLPVAPALPVYKFPRPVEQLNLTQDLTEYCWYYTAFTAPSGLDSVNLTVDSASAQAFVVYLDGSYVGGCYDEHKIWSVQPDAGRPRCA